VIASISFIDESIVKLFTEDQVSFEKLKLLKIKNMNEYDQKLALKMLNDEKIDTKQVQCIF
jgi:hypothetical protein